MDVFQVVLAQDLGLERRNLGVLLLGQRMVGGVGGFPILLALVELFFQLLDGLLGLVPDPLLLGDFVPELLLGQLQAALEAVSEVILDVLLGNLEAALEGGGKVAVLAQVGHHLADDLQGVPLVPLGCQGVVTHQLHTLNGNVAQVQLLGLLPEELLGGGLGAVNYKAVALGLSRIGDFILVHGYFSFQRWGPGFPVQQAQQKIYNFL